MAAELQVDKERMKRRETRDIWNLIQFLIFFKIDKERMKRRETLDIWTGGNFKKFNLIFNFF